jgi:hypothetical protein
MEKKHIIQSVLTAAVILGATTWLFLYAAGFRLQKTEDNEVNVGITGMVGAKSIPDGASVYLDNKLLTATDDTIAGVVPGKHKLKILKKGFVAWNKEIEIFPELVTDITAILVSQTPRLEPLTNTGAHNSSISPSLDKLAYFSNDKDNSGVGIIPLTHSGLSLFKSTPDIVLKDSETTTYSKGTAITWSPDESKLLVSLSKNLYYVVDLATNTAQSITTPNEILAEWKEIGTKKRADFLERLDIPNEIRDRATVVESQWSPDEKKFLYTSQMGNKIEYRVYNMEKPIPIGENVETIVFTTNATEKQPKVSWYSDSFHLILTNLDETEHQGTIDLIRIDGTNKTEVYSNTLYSDSVYSTPGGDKLIILTSFKSGNQTDLYTIGIR